MKKVNFEKKIRYFPLGFSDLAEVREVRAIVKSLPWNFHKIEKPYWEISVSCTNKDWNSVTTPYYPIFLYYLSSGRLWRETISDLETFGILENWSLRRGDRNQRFDCSEISEMQMQLHVYSVKFFVCTIKGSDTFYMVK